MRKLVLSFVTLFSFISLLAGNGYEVKLKQQTNTTTTIGFTVNEFDFKTVNLNGINFTKIIFDGKVLTKEKGFAELPFVNANVQLNPFKNVSMGVNPLEYTDIQLEFPLVPSRGVIYRNQDPTQIPYEIAPESMVDAFYPESFTNITEPYIIKDVRGTTVYFYPFQYNAVTQTLRVFTEVEVVLSQNNDESVNPLYQTSGKYFPEMEGLYKSVFINYENSRDDLTVADAGDILVITTSRDEDAIQPYIDWKMEKGYDVFKEVVSTGTNVKSLIQQKYDENNDINYVQLVGDWADIKCDLGGGANAPMDPMLGCVVGSDSYPDIAVGRFSAGSAAQVTTQVNKSINYEMNPSGDWYNNAIGVASNQGPGDDGELDYEQIDVIYDNKLEPFTYDLFSTAYDPTGTSTMVTNYIETGAGIINYCGHGSQNSWVSTGFSSSDVNQLSNGDMLPFIFSVACVNGAFHSGDCFAEAWLRNDGGGAIITLMATINQPWDPPMRGQDYFNDLITGGYDYSSNPGSGINTDEGRTIIGSVVANALTLMYTESNGSSDLETIQTWTTFGDAALQLRTDEAAPVTLSSNIMLVGADFETTITVNGAAFEGAMVALSQDGVYASAYTDANGNVAIPNDFLPGDVLLVVTGFNTETVHETIQCIPPSGPYVIFNEVEVNSTTGGLEYGETSTLNVSMKNVGVANASDVIVTITTEDTYVTIIDGTENFGSIDPDQVVMINDAFEVEVAEDIPDGHGVTFAVTAVSVETWESSFSVTGCAPILEYVGYSIDDASGNNNGFLDPGETVEMTIGLINTGSANAYSVMGELTSNDPLLVIENGGAQDVGDLGPEAAGQVVYTVTADENIVPGYFGELDLMLSADMNIAAEATVEIPFTDYCEASTGTEDEYIANVAFGEIDNSSGWQGGVANYTDMATTLEPGVAVEMTVENGTAWANDQVTAWIDWNMDKELGNNANEIFELTNVGGSGQTFTGNITPPANQQAGQYRLRIRMTYSSTPEPCGESSYGEVEDYTVFVGQSLSANFTADVTEGCEGMEVEFTDNSYGATSWNWSFPGGNPETSTEQNPTVIYNTVGDYDVTLEISDGIETNEMTKSNYITVMDVPGQAGPISGESEVAWGEVEEYIITALDECTLYDWVITPASAGTMVVSMNTVSVTWSNTWTGTATIKVCGGNDCGMGEYSDEFEVAVMDPTGIYEFDGNVIGIYPNPNTGRFNLELNSNQATKYQLRLVSSLGVEVINKLVEVNGNYNESIDISAMAEGVYYLFLRNDKKTVVEKIIVQ